MKNASIELKSHFLSHAHACLFFFPSVLFFKSFLVLREGDAAIVAFLDCYENKIPIDL